LHKNKFMDEIEIFLEIIRETLNDGLNRDTYAILFEKGKQIGLDNSTIDALITHELDIKLTHELGINNDVNENNNDWDRKNVDLNNETNVYEVNKFRSAITRGGSILTPDILIITDQEVIYKKRNKYLINVDTITIPIANISSVKLNTSLLGTDIIITSYGEGNIICKKFTISDAKKIKELIMKKIAKSKRRSF